MADEAISVWIERLKESDDDAIEAIWNRYFEKLVGLARRRLGALPRRVADEEDIALSAMNSFVRAAGRGRFPRLHDRDDLWRLLVTITARKLTKRRRNHFAAKRGGGAVHGESVFINRYDGADIADVLGVEPTAELSLATAETCRVLVEKLGDESLGQIVLLKLEGDSNTEIAEQLNCATRTIDRKMEKVRKLWSESDSI